MSIYTEKANKKIAQNLINELNSFCKYNHETGELILIKRRRSGPIIKIGSSLGSLTTGGYLKLYVNGKRHYVHRLVWLLAHGEFPTNEIDHINGNGLDNRLNNLRDVKRKVNMRNVEKYCHNTSGCTGVIFYTRSGKWQARIATENKRISLGYFYTFDLAVQARKEAEVKYGYTKRHGV